jgi:hypothetical protein
VIEKYKFFSFKRLGAGNSWHWNRVITCKGIPYVLMDTKNKLPSIFICHTQNICNYICFLNQPLGGIGFESKIRASPTASPILDTKSIRFGPFVPDRGHGTGCLTILVRWVGCRPSGGTHNFFQKQ